MSESEEEIRTPPKREFDVPLYRVRNGLRVGFRARPYIAPEKAIKPSPIAIRLALGHRYVAAVENGEAQDFSDLARKLKVSYAQVSALVSLTFLSPELQEAVACSIKGVGIGKLGMEGILPIAREQDWLVQGRIWESKLIP